MKFLLYGLLGRTYLLQYLTDTWSRFIRLQWWSIMWLITLQKNKVHFDFWADDVRFYWPDVFPSFSFKWVFFFFGVFYSPDMLNTSVFSAEWRLIKGRSLSVCAFFSCVSSEADVRAWNSSFFFFYVLRPSDMFHSTTICQCFPDLLSRRLAMPIHAAASVSLIFRVCCVFDSWGV